MLLQRLGKLTCAGLYFLEQPHVFDGDYCLIGEGGDQLNLFFGKWFHLGTADRECADGLIFPQQRDRQNRPGADAKCRLGDIGEIVGRRLNVVDMDRGAIEKCASILAEHFPAGAINRDELPNAIVEL